MGVANLGLVVSWEESVAGMYRFLTGAAERRERKLLGFCQKQLPPLTFLMAESDLSLRYSLWISWALLLENLDTNTHKFLQEKNPISLPPIMQFSSLQIQKYSVSYLLHWVLSSECGH